MAPQPLKIAYISLYTEMGGGEYGLYYLVKHLDRTRFQPVVIVNGNGPLVEMLRGIGVEVVTIPFAVVMLKEALTGRAFGRNFRAARELRRYFRSVPTELVQCTDVLALLLLLPALLTMRIRIVYSVIFLYEWPRAILFNLFALFFVWRVVFLSKMLRDDLGRKTIGLERKFETIYWGVDTSRFSPVDADGKLALRRKLGLPLDMKLVGFIGRYDTWKGHLSFLEAAKLLVREREDVAFLMVGGSPTGTFYPAVKSYKAKVDRWLVDHPLGERLMVWGHRDDVPDIMPCLDVFVCPSDFEPFGLVVIEALTSGVPVVTGKLVGALEVLDHAAGVLVAEEPTAREFCRCINAAFEVSTSSDTPTGRTRNTWELYGSRYSNLYAQI